MAAQPAARAVIDTLRSRVGTYGLLAVTTVVFTASLLFSFQRMQQQQELELLNADVSIWMTVQAEYELQRLRHAVDLYALDGGVDRDELLRRFEIFWSRLPVLVEGTDSRSIQSVESAAVLPDLIDSLARLEPDLRALRPADRALYRRVAEQLTEFSSPLRQLALDVKATVGARSEDQQRVWARLHLERATFLFGILASGGILIALLIRETRHTRLLLRQSRAAQARIIHLAHHDPLTDLPNRGLFNDRLEQALRRAERRHELVAIHCLDVDRFKTINDSLGHAAGDACLVELARRLRDCIRGSDTLARLGGDEFAVIQTDLLEPSAAALLAQRLVATLRAPLPLAGQQVRTSISVGVSLYPNHGTDASALLQAADLALYRAKFAGGDDFVLCEPERRESTPAAMRANAI